LMMRSRRSLCASSASRKAANWACTAAGEPRRAIAGAREQRSAARGGETEADRKAGRGRRG
jgi:hypothetical protein